jgi:hypothetical protein
MPSGAWGSVALIKPLNPTFFLENAYASLQYKAKENVHHLVNEKQSFK